MFKIDIDSMKIFGEKGELDIPPNDKKFFSNLAMLIEGKCDKIGIVKSADKYGLTRQSFNRLYKAFKSDGVAALVPKKTGPKNKSKITPAVVSQIIRHKFLDPKASVDVITQKLRRSGVNVCKKSVNRIFVNFGLEKKTPRIQAQK